MCIKWFGEVSKPYHEFIFYKEGNPLPEDTVAFGWNPFILQIPLSLERFTELKKLIIDDKGLGDTTSSRFRHGLYYLGYFEGSDCKLAKIIPSDQQLYKVSEIVIKFFKGTENEKRVTARWSALFVRLGIYKE